MATAKKVNLRGSEGDDLLRGFDGDDQLRGNGGNDALFGGAGVDRLWGGDGNDRLAGQSFTWEPDPAEINFMRGGAGDDSYYVYGQGDQVVERAGEGIDTVYTSVGFTLPGHVENLIANTDVSGVIDDRPLIGNALDNQITGGSWIYETIRGLDGDDRLDGGGRYGGFLDGGNGDDTLIQSFGEVQGGAGADLVIANGAIIPGLPVTVLDFNGEEGDRLHIRHGEELASADLFESGQLRFDQETEQLIFQLGSYPPIPMLTNQIFNLPGVEDFDPSWVTVGTFA